MRIVFSWICIEPHPCPVVSFTLSCNCWAFPLSFSLYQLYFCVCPPHFTFLHLHRIFQFLYALSALVELLTIRWVHSLVVVQYHISGDNWINYKIYQPQTLSKRKSMKYCVLLQCSKRAEINNTSVWSVHTWFDPSQAVLPLWLFAWRRDLLQVHIPPKAKLEKQN